MFAVTAEDAPVREEAALQATIVAAVVSPEIHSLADELRRDALQIAVCSADVMRDDAEARVYVFGFDAALAVALAQPVVEWSGGRAGLIGIIPDGAAFERETLLAAGFDDVVTAKLSARELGARIRAVHRRIHRVSTKSGRLRFGDLALDTVNRTLWTHGRTITLTSTEFEVMRVLVMARGRALSRVDLLEAVWGGEYLEVTERAVDNVILRLRRKLPSPEMLETIRGVGFRLDCPEHT